LNNSNKQESSKLSQNKNDEIINLDKELTELINENESLKKGITKIFKEIEKNNTTNKSN
jgi:seryl-tRNA synthetase